MHAQSTEILILVAFNSVSLSLEMPTYVLQSTTTRVKTTSFSDTLSMCVSVCVFIHVHTHMYVYIYIFKLYFLDGKVLNHSGEQVSFLGYSNNLTFLNPDLETLILYGSLPLTWSLI